MTTKPRPQRTRVQWNPAVHLDWGKERLYFWRLFFSTYSRDKVLPAIDGILREHDVTSFALYETMGFHDVILKAWLPSIYTQREFWHSLDEELRPTNMDVFYVDVALRHWPWGEKAPPRAPSRATLAERLSDEQIRRINAGLTSRDEARRYTARNLIVRVRPAKGIKFIVLVSNLQAQSLGTSTMTELQKRVCRILDDAPSVKEKSLYLGTGFGNSQFVILGRVPNARFHMISEEITEKINTDLMAAAFGARTYTYLSATPDLLRFEDCLPTTPSIVTEAERVPVEQYLLQDETETLEVKGSAFVALDPWLRADRPLVADDSVTDEGVLKTIVAFLNSDGGTLVLGALESRHYSTNPKVAACPRRGNYICCGVTWDYGRGKDWDTFQRRLHDVITSRIKAGPLAPWYTIAKELVEDRPLCVIRVQPPDQGWYYLYPADGGGPYFYVREGNRTIPLSGPEEDQYKAAKRRTPRGS